MKVGIVGAGMIVKNVLGFIHEVEGIELTAMCATPAEEEKVKEYCNLNNIKTYYLDYELMLKDDNVEVVYLGVPNHLHYSFSKKALLADKHVICEKPFTSNYKEAIELAAIAREKNLMILEAVSTHYIPNTLKIKEDLKDIGDIKIVSMNYSQYSSRYDSFKNGEVLPAFNPKMSGGALMDLNIYNINFAVGLFGEPQDVNYLANVTRGIDTSGILTLDYGAFKCVCIAAKDCKAPIVTNIQGDKGCIHIPGALNAVSKYQLLLNKNNASKQMTGTDSDFRDYNGGKHRMLHEFVEFTDIIQNKKYEKANEMLNISLITMKIQTIAREKAGVVFDADLA